jgi:hypothetical protein
MDPASVALAAAAAGAAACSSAGVARRWRRRHLASSPGVRRGWRGRDATRAPSTTRGAEASTRGRRWLSCGGRMLLCRCRRQPRYGRWAIGAAAACRRRGGRARGTRRRRRLGWVRRAGRSTTSGAAATATGAHMARGSCRLTCLWGGRVVRPKYRVLARVRKSRGATTLTDSWRLCTGAFSGCQAENERRGGVVGKIVSMIVFMSGEDAVLFVCTAAARLLRFFVCTLLTGSCGCYSLGRIAAFTARLAHHTVGRRHRMRR